MKLTDKVSQFIDDYSLKNKTVLVGFSGGYDSMCLLDAMHKLATPKRIRLVACHYNHNWRGEQAKKEQENCREFCEERGIEFYTDTAPDNVKKNETEARELRYVFFETASKKFNADCVMTAHNFDDNAETILYRIVKGTGINGLKGISPKRGIYYRPLITIERTEIEQYCRQHNLSPNYDMSNDDRVHKRNLIRHDIMPLLKKINPDVKKSLNNLANLAISESNIIDEYITKISSDLYDGNIIRTHIYKNLSQPLKQKVIYNLIYNSEFDYTMETVVNVCEFIENTISENKPSKFSIGKNGWVYADSNIIEITGKSDKETNIIEIDKCGEYKLGDTKFLIEASTDYKISGTENVAYVDLSRFPQLYIRTRRDGDVIYPLGSKGKMKLKKYLMSKKIPQHKRDNLLVLTDGAEILWVGGVGISEKIKYSSKVTHKISVSYS